jgi:DNA polymerase-3 subunit delta'
MMIIWMADKLNIAASNKLLKLIEEPPEKKRFCLISENRDVIQTIVLVAIFYFNGLSEAVVTETLVSP